MKKKNKNQRRKAKLKVRGQQRTISNSAMNSIRFNDQKLMIAIPDENKRLQYIRSLIIDMDRKLEVCDG